MEVGFRIVHCAGFGTGEDGGNELCIGFAALEIHSTHPERTTDQRTTAEFCTAPVRESLATL